MPEYPINRQSLSATADQPLIGVPGEEEGQLVIHYFTDEAAAAAVRSDQTLQDALRVIGAWSDLDWEETAADLDRIRHESRPTPPIGP